MKYWRSVIACVVVIAAAWGWYQWMRRPEIHYRTVLIRRADVSATINASGTIEPEEVVDVGAQVAGRIESLGTDPTNSAATIDYGSSVDVGTVLARIDDAIYETQVDQARANLKRSESDLLQLRVKVDQTKHEWVKAERLFKEKVIADSDHDLAFVNFESAKANLAIGESAIDQAKANLKQAEINLAYTTIKSPVLGVIIDRRVNIGQTVVASLNAPSLFLIAKDLKRLQIWVSVNEADIGQIHQGQSVKFSVDAYRGEVFEGFVKQIRLNATMTQNVVTYTVVVETSNANGKLLPYMTASVRFEIEERRNVLQVPNAALRWKPRSGTPAVSQFEDVMNRNQSDVANAVDSRGFSTGRIWILDQQSIRPVVAKVGLSDGTVTQIESDEIREGTAVAIGEIRVEESGGTTNPFTPQMFGGRSGTRP